MRHFRVRFISRPANDSTPSYITSSLSFTTMAVPVIPVTPTQTASAGGSSTGTSTSGASAGSGTAIGSGTGSATLSIPQTAAAGGLLMTMPPQTATASFYKIAPSNPITFGWNFTSLFVQPTSLTVSAVCNDNGNTYPVGGALGNGVLPGSATSVVWDPWAYEQSPGAVMLAQGSYTLHINDQRGPTALGTPGMFNAYSGLRFALYSPGVATPLASECLAITGKLYNGLLIIIPRFSRLGVSRMQLRLQPRDSSGRNSSTRHIPRHDLQWDGYSTAGFRGPMIFGQSHSH